MRPESLLTRWWLMVSPLLLFLVYMSGQGLCLSPITLPLTRRSTQGVGTYGQPIISYYAPVEVGTPAKVFNVQFDLALIDFFLPHYEWNTAKGYKCEVSTTCREKNSSYVFEYQDCKFTAKQHEDLITFTNASQNGSHWLNHSVPQNFLTIMDASDARFKDLPVDGFFGLSPQSTKLLFNSQLPIGELQFSMWLNSTLGGEPIRGGELILGGLDPTRYHNEIEWHPVSSSDERAWSLGLQHVRLGDEVVSCDGQHCEAILSSGVNEVFGPRADVQRVYELLGTTREGNLEFVDCHRIEEMPILTFTIDGKPYYLLPYKYLRRMKTSTVFNGEACYVAILPSDKQGQWVLGTNFLGSYYTAFHITNRQVGFAIPSLLDLLVEEYKHN